MSRAVRSEHRLTSIIIPCSGRLECTQRCISALFRHTSPRWELIVIDDASSDGTAAYLRGIHDAAPLPVRIVTNFEKQGFSAACKQGLRVARGEYLVFVTVHAPA